MHDSCICGLGEPCYHEAFVFSVGETKANTVELCIYQVNGKLSKLNVSNFSSWRKSANAIHLKPNRKVRRCDRTVMIDRILRQEHGLTIDCVGIAFLFFGDKVNMQVEDVRQVDQPHVFGDSAGQEYRKRYFRYFVSRRNKNNV
jgi:hypothetical protein